MTMPTTMMPVHASLLLQQPRNPERRLFLHPLTMANGVAPECQTKILHLKQPRQTTQKAASTDKSSRGVRTRRRWRVSF